MGYLLKFYLGLLIPKYYLKLGQTHAFGWVGLPRLWDFQISEDTILDRIHAKLASFWPEFGQKIRGLFIY